MSSTPRILGALNPDEFLRDYWQKQPLLVRNACPDYVSPLTANELAGLATEPDVESRIVVEQGARGAWELRPGPFTDDDFAQLPGNGWTLLVQAIDLWVPEAKGLLQRFDFLPAWRLDDLMVSYAPVGGSVGPHFDQYDVFLVQVEGERRWQLGGACDATTPLVADTDLQIIDNFVAEEDWLLTPGDMLYLPPNVAHWGVAESECLTFSVGFRSPLLSDMLGDLALELAAQNAVRDDFGDDVKEDLHHRSASRQHYRDPPLSAAMASERIDPAFIAQARRQLLELIDDDSLITDWFARYMTAPKYPDLVEETQELRTALAGKRTYLNGQLED